MVELAVVEQQLADIGASVSFWNRPEVTELQHILIPGEMIQACVTGRYEGGWAILCATDHRLLLIDKKLFHLSVEDLRYDMITEVDYGAQLLSGTIKICTPTKALTFTTFKPKLLRVVAGFIQQRVLEIRQQFSYQAQPQVSEPRPAIPEAPLVDPRFEAPATPQPLPLSGRNPYAVTPLVMRRKIGRFGLVATSSPS